MINPPAYETLAQTYPFIEHEKALCLLENALEINARLFPDYSQSMKLLILAAQSGLARANYEIANMYRRGRGVPKSWSKALEYYLKAAQMDDRDAQYKVAKIYHYGRGITQNIDKAAEYYHLAAQKLEPRAMKRCEEMYEKACPW